MTPRSAKPRTGATLVELLVVMSIIAALGALALMLLPAVANSDATLKAAGEVQTTLKISQAMAGTARLPRGVRLLVPAGGGTLCTEMQYLESPPVMVANQQPLTTQTGGENGPNVTFSYDLAGPPQKAGDPPQGAIVNRHCFINGLNADQASQVSNGSTLVLPTLGAWSRIKSGVGANNEVVLEVYPDALLGAASNVDTQGQAWPAAYKTYHFGVYGPPVPVIGEPTVQLPKDTAIDLAMSIPPGNGGSYDILFAPSGQLLVTPTNPSISPSSAVLLWIRDPTKVADMQPANRSPWTFDPTRRQFQLGGEQQIVGVRNGFVGTAPALQPDNGNGTYSSSNAVAGPYSLALQRLD